ncbi:hypothetical protein GLOTRDRAFT_73898 [Gloeophyllum trabeum ATCC 11539]|uniref:Hemerythrin-like domain-containing protein n=1 Tax=Gloeophyllum trabeum (strain ATCC 11539 / FP-39264 / Madison 617) TaxID=670483 RepID=S7RRH3_GLOTA|nr:uncharacterized protein GLOTRDRAFT_73898 [Gloeophyllum trabeum ATCC 11539]EPQ57245.1 hypothetical protein GLOTRDRAFT_73898 [Gloeophyllum trabeum ATCC 11539]
MSSGRLFSQDERRWNRLSTTMAHFHEWFKREFNVVYELADGSFNRRGMSLSNYLQEAKSLCTHLNFHHSLEERHIFPVLAERMPEFSEQAEDGRHIRSHKAIHKGLDDLERLIKKWSDDPSSYSPTEMRACLDSFRDVLFKHLDEEVDDLKGENMKKYWSLEEVDRIPM